MIAALNVDKLRLDMGEYVLSVQALTKRIGGRSVLDGVDIDVKRGSFCVLAGPSGAGKSLVLACIAGAAKPTGGRIRYFGYEIRGRREERVVRMGIARTHQTAQLFGTMTVLESATVGALLRRPRVDRARARAAELLALAGLADLADRRADDLAPDEQIRLELVRALATDPQLLLLDDPWSGVALPDDRVTELLAALRERGITVLAATRSADRLPSFVDAVVEIDRGITAGTGANAAIDLRA